MSKGKIALFDMDGTTFDYETRMKEDLCLLVAPGEENQCRRN